MEELRADDDERGTGFRLAARASYMTPVLAVAIGMLAGALRGRSQSATGGVIVSLVNLGVLSIGVLLALFSLLGVRRHGTRGIVGPAMIGLAINGFLILLFALSWAQWKRAAATRAVWNSQWLAGCW